MLRKTSNGFDFQLPNKQASSFNTVITKHDKSNNNCKQTANRKTLENLHKKAQELLNIGSISSTTSEASSSSEEKVKPPSPRKAKLIENSPKKTSSKVQNKIDVPISVHTKYNGKIETNTKDKVDTINLRDNDTKKYLKAKVTKSKKDKIKTHTKQVKESPVSISGR